MDAEALRKELANHMKISRARTRLLMRLFDDSDSKIDTGVHAATQIGRCQGILTAIWLVQRHTRPERFTRRENG
jgi:hypothetical protein